jgi:hypothetical protein
MGPIHWIRGWGLAYGIPGRQDDASSKHPCVYVIYYMLSSGGFDATCLQAIAKGVLDPRLPWADTCAVQFFTVKWWWNLGHNSVHC